ncbi:MAG: glycosyltransferase, partial [Gammaproteobacteria bacterium]|nr:glycosyltransferase [Gammaproteobacteria bacterium]
CNAGANLPMISMILCVYNMTREAPRTLHTLARQYQQDFDGEYEVIVVENGSSERLSEQLVCSFGPEFRYIYFDEGNPSPVRAINYAVSQSRGDIVCIMNDGARMLSPGLLKNAAAAFRAYANAVVTPLSWHLGPEMQMHSVQKGYCQSVEDKLLDNIPWRENGYSLFTVSVFAGSSAKGWFQPIAESNCLFMQRNLFDQLGGLDDRFSSPGGGLIALDFFRNAWLLENVEPVILLGEGTFHQVHGGIATNAPKKEEEQRRQRMLDEYEAIRGHTYEEPLREPTYFGKLPAESRSFLKESIKNC